MKELAEDLGPVFVDDGGEFHVSRDTGVVNRHQYVRRVARALVHPGHLDDDETRSPLGSRLVVRNELFTDFSVLDHDRVVSR